MTPQERDTITAALGAVRVASDSLILEHPGLAQESIREAAKMLHSLLSQAA